MPSLKPILRIRTLLLFIPLLGLSACGDGWEAVAYSGFPYNNIRTAGHGIAYVRENMLPGNGLVIEAVQPENKEIMEKPATKHSDKAKGVLNALDKAFNKEQRK